MYNKTLSKIFTFFIMASMASAVICSSGAYTVFGQSATLDDVLAELEILNGRLNDLEADVTSRLDSVETNITLVISDLASLNTEINTIESTLYSISATTASSEEIALLDSSLDTLNEMNNNILSIVESINITAATKSELIALSSTVTEISTTLIEVETNLDYLLNVTTTTEDLEVARTELNKNMETLQLLLILALVLGLIAAIAAVIALYVVLKKGVRVKK
jgi:predicted  nucleic acid-binding Zn-ribbon protein